RVVAAARRAARAGRGGGRRSERRRDPPASSRRAAARAALARAQLGLPALRPRPLLEPGVLARRDRLLLRARRERSRGGLRRAVPHELRLRRPRRLDGALPDLV